MKNVLQMWVYRKGQIVVFTGDFGGDWVSCRFSCL